MPDTKIEAVAKITVDIYIDAESLGKAEGALDQMLPEEDDRLVSYVVTASEWVPEIWVPKP